MRNLLKIFMTVVAGMMAFSCVTDTTDDLGVNLGKGQKTVISVSLEESRTYLGGYDKDAKKYPMYWSAGDKISANGVVSEAAVINTGNEAVASFEFPANANLTKPYFVTYPAVANAEGKWQVKFEDEQNYKNGTFDKGVSTMYGYSEESLNVQMNHLTGILKIGIVLPEGSENVTLKYAQISTVDRKPIAGTFDFAFETDAEGNKVPKLTPTADAKSVIEYIFVKDEGLPLDPNEPSYIHAAVPAGTYDELYVTLYDDNEGVMYATVKAGDSKPLAAGTVREFKKNDVEQCIKYTPIANNVTVIKDYDDLVAFKTAVEAGSTVDAVLVNDITVGADWKAIKGDNYAGTFYGNGYAIKGLTAPLFNLTKASFKGLHLEDVQMVFNDDMIGTVDSKKLFIGAIACSYLGSNISNCSVSGTIEMDLNGKSVNDVKIGGLVGFIRNNTSSPVIKDVHNSANITVKNTTAAINIMIGGCVAAYYNSANSVLQNVVNSGEIKCVDNNISTKTCYVGGIVSYFDTCTSSHVSNVQSLKAISISGTTCGALYCGGICGLQRGTDITSTNYKNIGAITITESTITTPFVGGLVGKLETAISNSNCYCTLSAAGLTGVGMVTGSVYGTATATATNCNIGGLILRGEATVAEPLTLDNYPNYVYGESVDDRTIVKNCNCGWLETSIDSAPQYKVVLSGEVTIGTADELVQFASVEENLGKDVVLTDNIDMSEVDWTPIQNFSGTFDGQDKVITGLNKPLFGKIQGSVKNVKLEGVNIGYYDGVTMTFNSGAGTVVSAALACIIENPYATIENCSASGDITINKDLTNFNITAGLVGYTSTTKTISGLVNSVNITIGGTSSDKSCYVAGCVGSTAGALENCQNLGAITFNYESFTGFTLALSGISYSCSAATGCTNGSKENAELGAITLNSSMSRFITISGVVSGFFGTSINEIKLNECYNYGKIGLSGKKTGSSSVMVGGVKSGNRLLNGVTNCYNYGDIDASNFDIGDAKSSCLGGIVGTETGTISNSYVYCTIKTGNYPHAGMLIGSAYKPTIAATGCKVGGTILKGDATEAVTLTGENYYNYIYGSAISQEDASGCTYWDGTEE